MTEDHSTNDVDRKLRGRVQCGSAFQSEHFLPSFLSFIDSFTSTYCSGDMNGACESLQEWVELAHHTLPAAATLPWQHGRLFVSEVAFSRRYRSDDGWVGAWDRRRQGLPKDSRHSSQILKYIWKNKSCFELFSNCFWNLTKNFFWNNSFENLVAWVKN